MVTITNYHRRQSKDGKEFIVLELQGGLEMVQSLRTGNFYATTKKCTITCTFDEATAKRLVGTEMPGTICREETDPYEYTVQSTGEVIQLAHTYQYRPDGYRHPLFEEEEKTPAVLSF